MAGINDEIELENPDEEREFVIGEDDEDEVVVADESETEAATEPDPEPEPEPAEAEPEKPRRARADQRIADLARERAELAAQLEAERSKRLEYERQLADERVAYVGQVEASTKAELEAVKKQLIQAKSAGDYDAEVELTARMSRLAADLSAIETVKVSQPKRQDDMPTQKQTQSRIAPETQAWVEANPWFNPQSPEYDEELAVEAQAFARKLEIRLKREGKANEIGSREYFKLIDEHLDSLDAPAKASTPPMKSQTTVAPVARQVAPNAAGKKQTVVRLTRDQREMAELMSPNLPREKAWAEYARYMTK